MTFSLALAFVEFIYRHGKGNIPFQDPENEAKLESIFWYIHFEFLAKIDAFNPPASRRGY